MKVYPQDTTRGHAWAEAAELPGPPLWSARGLVAVLGGID